MQDTASKELEMFQDSAKCSKTYEYAQMDQSLINEIARFAREALAGDSETATARLRRLLPKLDRINPTFAAALGTAVNNGASLRSKVFAQPPVDVDSRQSLVITSYPVILDTDPSFTPEVGATLSRVLKEWRAADALRNAGLSPIRSLLFAGPPGVGKTLAAGWIAKMLDLPLLTLDLATVMSSYLGKTGNNLRMVLDYAKSFPCVLFLDEFDAIAKRRDDEADIGELKRLVTVLLQSIDQWSSRSLLIGATNHGDLLDAAVWRRFDLTLEFMLPDFSARQAFFCSRGLPENLSQLLADITNGENYSNLNKIMNSAKKDAVLEEKTVNEIFLNRHNIKSEKSAKFSGTVKPAKIDRDAEIMARHLANEKSRAIGEAVGVSHSTVNRIIAKKKGMSGGEVKPPDRERRSTDDNNSAKEIRT